MKIVVTATAPSLDGAVDPRFGRCPYFVIVETDDLAFEAVDNPNVMLGGGAGIQSAQLMNDKGVGVVLTGNCGPNAYQTLSAAGIEVIVGCSGLVRDVVQQFNTGRLSATAQPNVASHFGVGDPAVDERGGPSQQPPTIQTGQQPPMAGMGMGGGGGARGGMGGGMGRGGGRGRGMGKGMGRGMGQGMGRGRGMAPSTSPPVPIPPPTSEAPPSIGREEELRLLMQQVQAVGAQMQEIQERIRQLEEERRTGSSDS
jgi:predicted Fe-Mo cluster-binding NifX family protein